MPFWEGEWTEPPSLPASASTRAGRLRFPEPSNIWIGWWLFFNSTAFIEAWYCIEHMVLIFFLFLFLSSEQDGECHKPNSRICWALPNCNWKLTPMPRPLLPQQLRGPRGNRWGTGTNTQLHWSSERDSVRHRPCCFSVTFYANYQAGRKRSEHQIKKSPRCRTMSSRHNLYLEKGTHINSRAHSILDQRGSPTSHLGSWPSVLPKVIIPLSSFFWSIT